MNKYKQNIVKRRKKYLDPIAAVNCEHVLQKKGFLREQSENTNKLNEKQAEKREWAKSALTSV